MERPSSYDETADWPRVKELFARALEQPLGQRLDWLASSGAPPSLVTEVRSLLAVHDRTERFLETPAIADESNAQAVVSALAASDGIGPGTSLPPYRIIGLLGDGGMGRVFLGERADDAYRMQVAIKIVRADLVTTHVVDRFLRERQILAELDHPNIARLIDAGATDAGLPYLVMEYVDGMPIDEYCAANQAAVSGRLALFETVCDVVSHAHGRRVIHRDLKASNILVSVDGALKLLDFGIAKILGPRSVDFTQTSADWQALTPESASPEQVLGGEATVATDVYALGLLLYRLLACESPYAITRATTPVDLQRAICEEMPPPPSTRAPEALRRDIPRDLDRIVMKALAKEPERRYARVADMADDLRRLRDGRPVMAADDSAAYRARKFVSRHRVALATIALVMGTAAVGAAFTWRQAQLADRRLDEVRRLTNTLLVDLPDAMRDQPGATENQRRSVLQALTTLHALDKDAGSRDPRIVRELAAAYLKLGDVLGNPYGPNLGATGDAIDAYEHGLALATTLNGSRDATAADLNVLVKGELALGDMLWGKAESEQALAHYRRAMATSDRPDAQVGADVRARILYGIGQVLLKTGRANDAESFYEKSAALYAECAAGSAACRSGMAAAEAKLGDVARARHEPARALQHSQRSYELARQSLSASPDDRRLRRMVAFLSLRVATDLSNAGNDDAAATVAREASATLADLSQSDPSNAQARDDVAYAARVVGDVRLSAGDAAGARAAYSRVVAIFQPKGEVASGYFEHVTELAMARVGLADVARLAQELVEERAQLEQAARLFDTMAEDTELMSDRAMLYQRLGLMLALASDDARRPVDQRRKDATQAILYLERAAGAWTTLTARGLLPAGATEQRSAAADALARARQTAVTLR